MNTAKERTSFSEAAAREEKTKKEREREREKERRGCLTREETKEERSRLRTFEIQVLPGTTRQSAREDSLGWHESAVVAPYANPA